jgi:hypothetical protein
VREASTELLVELDPASNVTDLLLEQQANPAHALYARKGPNGWTDITAQKFLQDVSALAKGLIAGGLEPGDTVAVMSATRYEWTLVDFAIWFAGGVTVPIYETSSASQIEWILHDSGALRVFYNPALDPGRHPHPVAPLMVRNDFGCPHWVEEGRQQHYAGNKDCYQVEPGTTAPQWICIPSKDEAQTIHQCQHQERLEGDGVEVEHGPLRVQEPGQVARTYRGEHGAGTPVAASRPPEEEYCQRDGGSPPYEGIADGEDG